MPKLFDDIHAENGRPPTNGCGVANLIQQMKLEDQTDLAQALQNPNISTAAIQRALRKNGHSLSVHTVGRHRRKDCPCGQTR
jgi:hypothetical protein